MNISFSLSRLFFIITLVFSCWPAADAQSANFNDIKESIINLRASYREMAREKTYQIGDRFLWCMFAYKYNDEKYAIWPWQNGRVRNGKYKASNTALEKYVGELNEMLPNQTFTLAKIVEGYNAVLTNEKGDSIFVGNWEFRFFPEKLLNEYKKLIGFKFKLDNDYINSTYQIYDKETGEILPIYIKNTGKQINKKYNVSNRKTLETCGETDERDVGQFVAVNLIGKQYPNSPKDMSGKLAIIIKNDILGDIVTTDSEFDLLLEFLSEVDNNYENKHVVLPTKTSISNVDLNKLCCLGGNLQDIVIGDTYIYNNALEYNDMQLRFPPYPWQDGRVCNEKYKSSPKAKDDYLKSLKALSGKKFKAVKTVSNVIIDEMIPPVDGVVMVDEKGDSILYTTGMGNSIMQFEFVNDTYFSELQKLVGKRIMNMTPIPSSSDFPVLVDTKTKQGISVPDIVEWKIIKISNTDSTPLSSGYTFYGVTAHIFNEKYGECFVYLLYLNEVFTLIE